MSVDEIFFDRVAHDLRGELSTMLAGVHYLLRFGRDLQPQTKDMLERVSGAGDRLARLLDELDDAVWLLDTKKPLVFAPINITDLLDDVVARISKAVAQRGSKLVIEMPEHAGEFVGDAEVLAKALLYVVDLATIRAAGQTVTISADVRDGAPVVVVTDKAGVVPEGLLARIFEPFVEREILARDPAPRQKQRLGIGLPIARAILEAHGGSLVAETTSAAPGLTLTCTLAAVATVVDTAPPRAASG